MVAAMIIYHYLSQDSQAPRLQQLHSREQRFDLLTFQSLDHHCNGLADSTWTSWLCGATDREATEHVSWRLSQSVEATMCAHMLEVIYFTRQQLQQHNSDY